MIPIKSFINTILLSVVLLLVSCVKDSAKKDEVKGSPEILNRLIANNITPANFPSKTQSIVTLNYTSIDSDLATSCNISQLSHVSVTQACSCDQLGVCSVGVTADAAYTGSASFAYNVVAAGKTSTTGRANFSITAPPAGSNQAPTISSIGAKTTTEGLSVSSSFTVADSDSVVSCLSVTAASANTTLVPNTNIIISGSGTNCTVTVTPAANQIGSSTITLTLTDTGSPLPAQTATSTFTVTVNAYNDPPTIGAIAAQTTNEDTSLTGIAFTIGDVDSVINCSNVTATTTNSTLIATSNIVIGGAGTNCTVSLSPSLNQYGTASITLTVRDNGSPLPVKTASTTFSLSVFSVNDAPVISAIATQNTNESVAKTVNFTITDVDSNLNCPGSVVITSSNTTLVPNTNISITGIAPNCMATITPANTQSGTTTLTVAVSDNGFPMPVQTTTTTFNLQVAKINHPPTIAAITNQTTNEDTATSGITFTIADSDSTVYCSNVTGTSSNTTLVSNANIVVSGTAPNCVVTLTPSSNAYGSATITLTLTDNGTPMPAQTATSIFTLTVNAVNDVPTVSAITTQSTGEGTASSAIAFSINDSDSTLSCTSSMTATSSNTGLIPNANIVFGGTAPSCTVTITPVATGFGSSTITLTLTDNGTPMPALTATTAFAMNVTQVNHTPVISAIAAQSTNEDVTKSGIAFTISDSDSTVYCNNVAGTSSNTGLIPNANIVITGTAPNCFAAITPVANASGSAMITLTLTDNGTPLPPKTATSAFTLTVDAVNDAPTISAITNKITDEDTATSSITFTISDIDSTLTCNGSVTGTSSNTALVPNANIVVAGAAPNCSAVITPTANANGSSTITLTVSDNGTPMPSQTANTAFVLTVTAVPDLSGTLSLTSLSGVASSYAGNTYARQLNFTGLSTDESLTSLEVCLGTASGSCDVSSWVDASFTPSGSAPSISIGGNYRMKSGANGAQVFTLTPSCSSTTDYYYSVRGTSSLTRISNIVSTPAWSFWEPTCLGTGILAQWLDASEGSTITTVTGVSNWTDKSGNGRTVTQATGAKQPIYSSTAFGTLPGVTFNGSSHSLTRAGFAYNFGAASFFTVIKAAAVVSNKFVFSEAGSATNNTYYAPLGTTASSTITGQTVGNTGGTPRLNLPASSAVFFDSTIRLAMSQDTGTNFTTWSNGTPQSQIATTYTRATSTIDTYRLGAKLIRATESGWFAGTIGEFIIINGTLSISQRQKLEGYSAHKWGVGASLPGVHPYQITPP